MTRYAYAVEGYDTSSYMMELVSINEKWYIYKADSYQSEKKPEPPNFGKPRKLEYGDGGDTTSLFVEDGGAWLIVVYDGGWITVRAFFSDLKWYEEKLSAIKAQYPEKEEVKDDLVPISLTFNTQNGPRKWNKRVAAAAWKDAVENYPKLVSEGLGELMLNPPKEGGKLVLWQGPPGTGKTHAVRSLMKEWQGEAKFLYVIDPESFFGAAPEYMVQTIIEASGATRELYNGETGKNERLLVLILEDSGELLSADAKERTGQGLSRMLNLVDGMIGQGLNLLILITTNEDISTFHPAVMRPGRCVQALKFTEFGTYDSNAWLESHGCPTKVDKGKTIAELYAILNGWREGGFTGKADTADQSVLYT